MSAGEEDLSKPSSAFPEEGTELLQRVKILKKVWYKEAEKRYPPYMLTIDHEAKDVTLAVRGMSWRNVDEFMTLIDNRKGRQKFSDGFVHNGMLRSAGYLLDEEMDNLNTLMLEHKDYTLTLAGHSLGSGVVCLMTLVLLQNMGELKGISRDRIRCHCFAPARCVSLNIAVSSADVVNSIILQDDFLPRMNYPLETIFGFWFCLPCILQWACCVDFFIPPQKLIKDPRRLYPPGRLFHILYTDGGKCNVMEVPPISKVAVPVDGRFEKLIISRTTHADHLLTTIYAKLGKLMEAMSDKEEAWEDVPTEQKMQRMQTMKRERYSDLVHALERAQSLEVPNAFDPASARKEEEEISEEFSGPLGPEVAAFTAPSKAEVGVSGSTGFEGLAEVGGRQKSERPTFGKWSKIIDDLVAAERKKDEDNRSGTPKLAKKWSLVRRAVKDKRLEPEASRDTGREQDTSMDTSQETTG